jgi:hypothetical protein
MRLIILSVVCLAFFTPNVHAQIYGRYSGEVQTSWDGGGRTMRLLAPFSYFDPKGQEWKAPIGAVVDGASIPRFAWSIIGGPFEGKYRDASVIHDVACDEQKQPWDKVHETFYFGMMCSGVEPLKAKIMYAAVYWFGPRWPSTFKLRALDPRRLQSEVELLKARYPGAGITLTTRSRKPGGSPNKVTNEREIAGPWKTVPLPRMGDALRSASEGWVLDADIQITPSEQQLGTAEFEAIKAEITRREASAGGGMTLEEIRRWPGPTM